MAKNLLKMLPLLIGGTMFSQFSTGTVTLPATAMTIKIDTDATNVTMTLAGSSTAWLGVGFGSDGMASGADGFIYNSTANRDYMFNGVGLTPSADAAQNWTELSNTVTSGKRTLIVRRTLAGGAGDFGFTNSAGSLPIFYAKGTSLTLANHGGVNRDFATLTLSPSLAVDDLNTSAKKVGIYPNPVNNILNLSNSDNVNAIKIYDATGKQVLSQRAAATIDVSQLQKGIYYIEFENVDGLRSFEKIIKN